MKRKNSESIGLFSGIGGFELGLSRAGFRTRMICEIDPGAREVLTRRFQFDVEPDVRQLQIGLAFFTFDLEPLERGYEGPIKMLVGMTLEGRLTAVEVLEHREPYGYFSIETRAFQNQFDGKSVDD
ncbi:MAG: hypothetical protein CL477_05030 [Acidobacteria bacterium]|jgi:site-specific DNA-cytosine methylase|nr:hypothetical protein [Acidobacteriota bacterium]MDP7479701.1 DNA cytosine methyltransferase [Vicinamibacterales bacterium]MDP7692332.1 DNA cytosine methyltransferase [Vicinamibacterales bacterium]HJN44091.1 DNA cytosine methyltransferase [Vicinamibacterales bacterium]|tara:strand:- start:45 stop:422 length:378 start_codon:yes stop_codon:yes gene_type:complete